MFTVYQISSDHKKALMEYMPEVLFRMTFDGKVNEVDFLAHYSAVAKIDAATLDQVFEIGNIGPESLIERLDRMHSISVGDVIVDEAGTKFVVSSFGFDEIVEREAA